MRIVYKQQQPNKPSYLSLHMTQFLSNPKMNTWKASVYHRQLKYQLFMGKDKNGTDTDRTCWLWPPTGNRTRRTACSITCPIMGGGTPVLAEWVPQSWLEGACRWGALWDMGPESGKRTGNVTGSPTPMVIRLKTLPCPILRMRTVKRKQW